MEFTKRVNAKILILAWLILPETLLAGVVNDPCYCEQSALGTDKFNSCKNFPRPPIQDYTLKSENTCRTLIAEANSRGFFSKTVDATKSMFSELFESEAEEKIRTHQEKKIEQWKKKDEPRVENMKSASELYQYFSCNLKDSRERYCNFRDEFMPYVYYLESVTGIPFQFSACLGYKETSFRDIAVYDPKKDKYKENPLKSPANAKGRFQIKPEAVGDVMEAVLSKDHDSLIASATEKLEQLKNRSSKNMQEISNAEAYLRALKRNKWIAELSQNYWSSASKEQTLDAQVKKINDEIKKPLSAINNKISKIQAEKTALIKGLPAGIYAKFQQNPSKFKPTGLKPEVRKNFQKIGHLASQLKDLDEKQTQILKKRTQLGEDAILCPRTAALVSQLYNLISFARANPRILEDIEKREDKKVQIRSMNELLAIAGMYNSGNGNFNSTCANDTTSAFDEDFDIEECQKKLDKEGLQETSRYISGIRRCMTQGNFLDAAIDNKLPFTDDEAKKEKSKKQCEVFKC